MGSEGLVKGGFLNRSGRLLGRLGSGGGLRFRRGGRGSPLQGTGIHFSGATPPGERRDGGGRGKRSCSSGPVQVPAGSSESTDIVDGETQGDLRDGFLFVRSRWGTSPFHPRQGRTRPPEGRTSARRAAARCRKRGWRAGGRRRLLCGCAVAPSAAMTRGRDRQPPCRPAESKDIPLIREGIRGCF